MWVYVCGMPFGWICAGMIQGDKDVKTNFMLNAVYLGVIWPILLFGAIGNQLIHWSKK